MKDGTKKGPHHIGGEGQGRVTADTVVTDGRSGTQRLRGLIKHILEKPKGRSEGTHDPSRTR